MKKKLLALVLSLAMVVAMLAGCTKKDTSTSTSGSTGTTPSGDTNYEYDITVWVPEKIVDLTKTQIEDFNNTNTDGIKLNATVAPVSEADAATQMLTDVEAGADLFGFVQDQLGRLIQGGALAQLGDAAAEFVRTNNDASSVSAVTSGDALYGYPYTSDNGYYLFYDKSLFTEDDVKTVDGIIAACKKTGRTFCFDIENGFYVAGFFFGVGCDSTWVTDDDGNFISVNDTFNSDKGLIAAKGVWQIMSSGVWNGSSEVEEFQAAIPAGVVVSGPWKNEVAKEILGDNWGTAKLPTYTVDGKEYQIGSFAGGKMLGVKPQTDPAKGACLSKLAQYLSGEKCQLERYEAQSFGPSNVNAQANEKVQNDPGLRALAEQAKYAKPQGNVHGKWWDISKGIATGIKGSDGTDEALKGVLQTYFDSINAVFTVTADEAAAFSVIGGMNGDGWSTDLPLTQIAEAGDAIYYSEPIKFAAGDEFKVRQGGGWDVNFGANGEFNAGSNCVAEEDGYFFVKFTPAADLSSATIELVKTSYYGWAVIGTVNGTNWDTDLEMEIQEDGTTYKLAGVEVAADSEFKVRKNHDWNENYGADGVAGGDNIKGLEAGTYTVTFDSLTGQITVEK
ncbi:MAG: extracellular solute-binding protein [Lachnospiraceae bacterium]|nr:extracellular solute-binding protein [Lachnospiraceae bacterium]